MRRPPNLRNPDNCSICMFYNGNICELYNYNLYEPCEYTCDDFRKEANEMDL